MISIEQALSDVLDLFSPLDLETVHLRDAGGRVLARDVVATRNQPPFAASAMDGYAVKSADLSTGAVLNVIGESAAGSRFDAIVQSGQAVRIFTGGVVPDGADRILIQEDCTRQGDQITVGDALDTAHYIRPLGGDFKIGDCLSAPRKLSSADVGLIAAMNVAKVQVYRKPIVALLATGDELVEPGGAPNPDQINSSNNYALKAMIDAVGGHARLLPIARDNVDSLRHSFELAQGADVLVTLGGASVGDYDLVATVGQETGLDLSFYKVAMRPGKPLMAGRINGTPMIGLPGNPVSSIVCAHVLLRPALNAMLGLGKGPLPEEKGISGSELRSNGPRQHYMRAQVERVDGQTVVTSAERQDSSLLSVMSASNALLIRRPNDGPVAIGEPVRFVRL